MTDDRFEHELRGFLAARQPAAVSPVLRARLQAVSAEPPVRAGALGGRLGGAWRAGIGLAATAAVAVILLAILARADAITVPNPGPIGGPSLAPVVPTVPFVTAPTGFFSAAAVAEADRRLSAIFETSAIEGRLIVLATTGADQLSTPPGWPVGFKADRIEDADITAILGVAPDGAVTCCVTIEGGSIDRAKENMYWRPQSRPDRLEADLESDDPAVRDAALERFVRGIEELEPGIALVREAVAREATIRQVVTVLIGLGMFAAFLVVIRSRWSASRPHIATDPGPVDGPGTAAPLAPAGGARDVPTAVDAGEVAMAPVGWGPAVPTVLPRDRSLLAIAVAAFAGLVALAVWDLIAPAAAGLPLDVSAQATGLASPGFPVAPLALLGAAAFALFLVARNGGRRRRVALGALVVLVGLCGWWAFDGSRPTSSPNWVRGVGAGSLERGPGSIFDFLTYPLEPDDPFTLGMSVRNDGPLPVTILGLDGIQATKPNPYAASLVGLGSVEQPLDDGMVTTLSSRPEDASVAWPRTIGPGEELALVVLGRAGPCAEAGGAGGSLPILWVHLTYRVLGIERSEPVGLPVAVFVPEKATCTVEVPGGTVTYGTPGE